MGSGPARSASRRDHTLYNGILGGGSTGLGGQFNNRLTKERKNTAILNVHINLKRPNFRNVKIYKNVLCRTEKMLVFKALKSLYAHPSAPKTSSSRNFS